MVQTFSERVEIVVAGGAVLRLRDDDADANSFWDILAQDIYNQGGYPVHNHTLGIQFNQLGLLLDFPRWGKNYEAKFVAGAPPNGLFEANEDFSSVARTVSGAANNGSGAIRLTISTTVGWRTGESVSVAGVAGTTEANTSSRVITVIDSSHIDLQGSTFTNAYVSGGSVRLIFRPYSFNVDLNTDIADLGWRLGEYRIYSRDGSVPVFRVSTNGDVVSIARLLIGDQTTSQTGRLVVKGTFTGGAFARLLPDVLADGDIVLYMPLPTMGAGDVYPDYIQGNTPGYMSRWMANGGAGGVRQVMTAGSTGDAYYRALAGQDFSFGVDRSAAAFVISNADTLGTNNRLVIDSAKFAMGLAAKVPTYAKADLPNATTHGNGMLAYVSDVAGGTLAMTIQGAWRYVSAWGTVP